MKIIRETFGLVLLFSTSTFATTANLRGIDTIQNLSGGNSLSVPAGGSSDTLATLKATQTFSSGSTWNGVAIGTSYGGTGQTTYTDGQLLIGNTSSGGLSKATLTAGSNITITNGSGTITIASTASGGGTAVNWLYNSGFRWWQRAQAPGGVANGSSTYGPDRWYVKNSLGTSGVITMSQASPVITGSSYGMHVQITTAPTALQTNGTETYQVIESPDTNFLLNNSISASVNVKALNNVNQVGIAFVYATTETKPTTLLGTEATCTVNSSTFTLCSVTNVSVGTTPTVSGVVGIRIRITGVSTGNTYDLNNGYVFEQAEVNIGSSANSAWALRFGGVGDELLHCYRFYEKTYEPDTDPGSNTITSISEFNPTIDTGGSINASRLVCMDCTFKTIKRTSPTVSFYSQQGTAGDLSEYNSSGTTVTVSSFGSSIRSAVIGSLNLTAPGNTKTYYGHWTAESEI